MRSASLVSYPELFASSTTFSWKVGTANWDNGRTLSATSIDGKSLVVVGNFALADKNFSVTFQETGTWYELLKDNEPLNVSSTTQTIAVPAHEFHLYSDDHRLTGRLCLQNPVQNLSGDAPRQDSNAGHLLHGSCSG